MNAKPTLSRSAQNGLWHSGYKGTLDHMRIGEVRAVVEIYRCSQMGTPHGTAASPEQIHKLLLVAARVSRLTADGILGMSDRQIRAFDRAMREAEAIAAHIGADVMKGAAGLMLIWPGCASVQL